ncbi:hypothetical protein A936_08173 [Enterobacter sp. Ag1]|nr:hypothetical protein A936_08173 [Enterobacter sp. Ag1]
MLNLIFIIDFLPLLPEVNSESLVVFDVFVYVKFVIFLFFFCFKNNGLILFFMDRNIHFRLFLSLFLCCLVNSIYE